MTDGIDVISPIIDWYDRCARDLPWRRPGADPWRVLVSEVMLQQTPVNRVLPVYHAWIQRWPDPAALAAASAGEAVRSWGKLGYPRRALRLHEAAREIVARFDSSVPDDVPSLRSLPGVGDYTARAVATFAFGQRHPVVDVNVRRVVARAVTGVAEAGPASATRDLAAVEALLPADPGRAGRASIALMELGALVCTARGPDCAGCPLAKTCAWRRQGSPPYRGPAARTQRFIGTDRQVRGLLLDVLRAAPDAVTVADLDIRWHDAAQQQRALSSLVADGLVEQLGDGTYALPR